MRHLLHVDSTGLGWSLVHTRECEKPCGLEERIAETAEVFTLAPGSWIIEFSAIDDHWRVKPLDGPVVLA